MALFTPVSSPTALTLVAEVTATGAASVIFSSGLTSLYKVYELHLSNVVPAANSALLLHTSADGGATWATTAGDYSWQGLTATGSTPSAERDISNGASLALTASNLVNLTATGGYSGIVRLIDPAGTTHKKVINVKAGYFSSATTTLTIWEAAAARMSAAAYNAIRVTASGGNLSGLFKLYGVS